jgi:phenylalanyl-tRNA synthetase alpha chain
MSNLKKKISLPSEAIEIYKEICLRKKISVKELEKMMKLDRGKLEYFLGYLISNELVERITIVQEKPILTEAGQYAALNQLIERRIVDLLREKKSIDFDSLSEKIKGDKREMNAGVGFLKKQGILQIDKGEMSLINPKVSISDDLQRILEGLSSGKEIEIKDYEKTLVQRNLISLEERKESFIEMKIAYGDISENIVVSSEVSRLSPEMIRNGSWRKVNLREYNLDVSPPDFYSGRKQPYARFLDEVKQKLIGYGFQEMRGPIVELEYWNFDALFQAQDHPAREWSDVYRIANPSKGRLPKENHVKLVQKAHENGYDTGSKGWRYKWDPMKSARLVLRAQGTSVSARTLVDLPIPSKYFSISRCFRPDTTDATHLSEFNQAEGIVCDPSITFRDLLGILETFAIEISEAPNYTFKPDYYPFTEPSVELSVKDPVVGHIEYGGAGIFRPEVTKPFGIDAPVIAWGLGVDRLFMVKYGITDIRELYSHKLDWLRSTRMS